MSDIIPPHLLAKQDIQSLNSVRVYEPNFVEFLRKQRAFIYTQMEASADTAELHCLRGQAGVMTRLIALIEDAGNAAERMQQPA